jgi:hypothetical protein
MATKINQIKIGDNLHDINSKYWGNYNIESLKTINGESILEEGGGDINPQFIEIEYSDLKSYRDNNKLIPGRHYRITDYNTKTNQPNTESANHQFDIVVTADGTNSLSEVASSCFHDGDNYFNGVNLGAWELRYCLDNDTNRFTWADSENGKGVIYYMKDEFGNEAPYDFKNIKFIYNSDFLTENANWKSAVLGQFTGTQLSFYTFSYYNTQSGVADDSLKVQSNHYAHGNKINNYFRNEDGKLTLNNIVFVATKNSPYNNIIENGCNDCIFGDNCHGNTIGFDSSSNVVGNGFYNNKIGSEFKRNKIYNTGSNPKFHSNILGNYCEDNFFPKQFVSCECGDNFTNNDFFTNTSNPNLSSVTNCIFGNNFKNNTGMNTTLSNIEILNNTLSGKGNWNDIIVDNGKTINKCLSDYKGLGYFKLFIGLDENDRVFLRDFNEQCVYHMGNFENISSALQHASNVEIAGNISLSKISFTTGTIDNSLDATNVGLHTGYIEQYISGNVSTQVIIWQSGFRMRKITFTDNNRTAIDDNKTTDSIKKGEGAGVYWSNPTSLYYDQASHKIALNRFDDGQKWGLSGCFGEVEIPLVSNSRAGLMSVDDKSLLTDTSALLNKFVKSKVYNSLPNYVGGDWYSHKRYWYRFAKINDKSPNIFRISTNAANDVIFTSSIGWSNGSTYDVTGALSVINTSLNSNENHACIEGVRLVASSSGGYIDMLLNTPYSNSNGYVEIYVTCISTIFNNNDYEPLYNNIEKLEEKGVAFERNGETIVQSFDLVDKAIMSKDFILTNESGEQISVADSIVNKLSPIQNIIYSDLKDLRDNNNLTPGQKYRITDYVTTTSQANTQSARHQFDIIVEALNENTLSEDAKAIQNENDGYFDEANLEAWELKYCLDNDTSRFAWAIENKTIVTENYRIKPELINGNTFVEPFTFDGQILIDTAEFIYEEDNKGDIIYEWGYETEPNGEDSLYIIKNGEGYENEGMDYDDKHYYRGTINIEGEVYDKWEKYEVNQNGYYISDAGGVYLLTKSIVEEGSSEITIGGGKGVIYYLKDEFNNECPYDFKNIQFVRYRLNPPTVGGYSNEWQNQLSKNVNEMFENNYLSYIWHGSNSEDYYWEDYMCDVFSTATEETKAFYTFSNVINGEITDKSLTNVCYSNIIKELYGNNVLKLNYNIFVSENINSYCYNNSFGNNCNSNSFGNDCYNNSFGNNCYSNSFGNNCYSNSFGNDCYNNSFGNDCYNNSFGNNCRYNSFSNSYNHNSFGNYCHFNSFGNYCYFNSFGNNCHFNSFGNSCNSNSFGNYCHSNSLCEYCRYNSLGDNCLFISFGDACESNSFGDACEYNSFGNDCFSNSFSNYCYNNSFGNDCSSNSFDNDCFSNSFGNSCNSNSLGEYCDSITFGDYCNYNSFGNSCYSNSFGNECFSNSFGNDCFSNSFGNSCNYNSFGNSCHSNGFYDDSSYSFSENLNKYIANGDKLNYVQYVTLNEGCHHLLFHTSELINEENKVQNITVTKGVKSIETKDGKIVPLLLEIPVTNNEYELKIACNSNGDIKMYCEADLIQ